MLIPNSLNWAKKMKGKKQRTKSAKSEKLKIRIVY
jgi:hypothetical protein